MKQRGRLLPDLHYAKGSVGRRKRGCQIPAEASAGKNRESGLTGAGYRAVNGAGPGIEHAKHSCTATQVYGQANPDSATVYLAMMRTCTGDSWRRGGQAKIAVLRS